jgi:hypothetical protein
MLSVLHQIRDDKMARLVKNNPVAESVLGRKKAPFGAFGIDVLSWRFRT